MALELISLVSNGCQTQTGIIVNADKQFVYLMGEKGGMKTVRQRDVTSILIYNILENPFSHLTLKGNASDYLKNVEIRAEEDTYQFTGWPIRFLEGSIIFYDVKGKLHLVSTPSIYRFSPVNSKLPDVVAIEGFKSYQFDSSYHLPECGFESAPDKTIVKPVRMLSDKIKVTKFFNTYEKGFGELKRFQQRTQFYPRPYLYDRQTKLGLMLTRKENREELAAELPFYFQWSSGLPYGAQGEYSVGGNTSRWLPNVEPLLSIQTEVKSHFLNVSFIGNPWALSTGSSFIIENRVMFSEFFEALSGDDALVFSQFNHMALTGADWKEFSIAGGFYYPIFGIYGNKIFREVVSVESSPIFRAQYTGNKHQLSWIYSQSRQNVSSPSQDDINLIYGDEMRGIGETSTASKALQSNISEFQLNAEYLRFGWVWDYSKEVTLGLDEVIFQGKYAEVISGETYQIDFQQFITSAVIQQNFSHYLSLKSKVNYFIKQHDVKSTQGSSTQNDTAFSFSVAIEFIM